MKSMLSALGLATVLAASPAWAQSYPAKPITMIVPFAAGGPTDVIARIVADNMSKTLGQQIVVENVAGAGGTTGTTRAAQSARWLHHHDGPYGYAWRSASALSQSEI